MKIIDPHLHLFNIEHGDYHWLKASNSPRWPDKHLIARNFTEQDLQLQGDIELSGFVHIEAGFDNAQPWRELNWLERHVQCPFKSIAFVALDDIDFTKKLSRLIKQPSLVGIRHILEDDAVSVLTNPCCKSKLQLLADHNLLFECQTNIANPQITSQLVTLLKHLPQLHMVINHCGMPDSNQVDRCLAKNLNQLAQFPRVSMKCSGFEMRDRHWRWQQVEHMLNQLIDIFTLERVMLASNFPLTLFSQSYQSIWQGYQALPFTKQQLHALCYANAKRIYRL